MDLATCTCWLVLTTVSQHVDPAGMRQYNPGVGIEANGWAVGEYVNSLDRKTWYGGYKWNFKEGSRWKFGLMGAFATGYNPIHGLHVLPIPVPVMAYEGQHFGANV